MQLPKCPNCPKGLSRCRRVSRRPSGPCQPDWASHVAGTWYPAPDAGGATRHDTAHSTARGTARGTHGTAPVSEVSATAYAKSRRSSGEGGRSSGAGGDPPATPARTDPARRRRATEIDPIRPCATRAPRVLLPLNEDSRCMRRWPAGGAERAAEGVGGARCMNEARVSEPSKFKKKPLYTIPFQNACKRRAPLRHLQLPTEHIFTSVGQEFQRCF